MANIQARITKATGVYELKRKIADIGKYQHTRQNQEFRKQCALGPTIWC